MVEILLTEVHWTVPIRQELECHLDNVIARVQRLYPRYIPQSKKSRGIVRGYLDFDPFPPIHRPINVSSRISMDFSHDLYPWSPSMIGIFLTVLKWKVLIRHVIKHLVGTGMSFRCSQSILEDISWNSRR